MADPLQTFLDALETSQGSFEDRLLKTIEVAQRNKTLRMQEEDRELKRISNFQSRLGNSVTNYISSGDIYDESKIADLKESINNTYSQYSTRNPELISEFAEERDSILGVINNYSTKNKEKDALLSKINPTKEKLFSIVETLNSTATASFSPEDKVKFRNEVYSVMEDVTRLDKIIDDPYFANLSGWSNVVEDVKYGLTDASKQLISQINIWDADQNVISEQDLDNLERAIFKNDTKGIRLINKEIADNKTNRMQLYTTEYAKLLKNYEVIKSFSDTKQYQTLKDEKAIAYAQLDKQGKINADNDPMYWFAYPGNIPGIPEEGVNLKKIDIQTMALKAKAEDIDAKYRNESLTGDSIAEILNRPLPWNEKRNDSLNTKVQGEQDFAPYSQEETTEVIEDIGTGEKYSNYQEKLHKEFANKYKTSEEHIQRLWERYNDDDTANMLFPEYLNIQANEGEFKILSTDDTTKTSKVKIGKPLTYVKNGKTFVSGSHLGSGEFKESQNNLKKIASEKFNIKENKNKYKNVRNFTKAKFEEWLNKNNKINPANWWTEGKYKPEDFIYFMPTKVDKDNKINSNKDMNLYNLYYPPAFSGAKGNIRMNIRANLEGGYLQFAKDFDDFRKFLQEQ